MIINIRNNVFETNSSSSHSVTMNYTSSGILETIVPDDNGNILLNGGNFSYPELNLYDSLNKANFIATYIMVYGDEELKERFESVLKNHTGAKEIIYDIRLMYSDGKQANTFFSTEYSNPYNEYEDGDVDRVVNNLSSILKEDYKLKNFIFNKHSRINAEISCDY